MPDVPADPSASARYERERAFHDERYALDPDRARAEKFYEAADASAARYRAILAAVPAGSRVLEYGCGTGSAAFDLAERGCQVVGIDISPVAIEEARSTAIARQVADSTTFEEMNAESLELPDESFDLVCGSGVLHHLDLDNAYAEVARVLRRDGRAVFVEPLGHNPLINAYRRRTPEMRTPDEHPLRVDDFEQAEHHFEVVEVDYFNLLTIAAVPFRRVPLHRGLHRRLEQADRWLFRHVRPLRRHAWVAVMQVSTPRGR